MKQESMDRLGRLDREIEEKMEERRRLLQEESGETVENYRLRDTDGNEVSLAELFGDHDELILIHNMGRSCAYCTLWADGFNGVAEHLADRAAFVLVSPDRPEVQKEFAEGRNWRFETYSAADTSFIADMGYTTTNDEGKIFYLPGYSVFTKEEDGTIRRTGRDFFGPMDLYAGIWHLFAMLPAGPNGWHPRFSYEQPATSNE